MFGVCGHSPSYRPGGGTHSTMGISTWSGTSDQSPVAANFRMPRSNSGEALLAATMAPWGPRMTGTNLLLVKKGRSSWAFSRGVEVSQVPWAMTVGMDVSKFCRNSSPRSLSQTEHPAR